MMGTRSKSRVLSDSYQVIDHYRGFGDRWERSGEDPYTPALETLFSEDSTDEEQKEALKVMSGDITSDVGDYDTVKTVSQYGNESITYETGPKFENGHLRWKECYQTFWGKVTARPGRVMLQHRYDFTSMTGKKTQTTYGVHTYHVTGGFLSSDLHNPSQVDRLREASKDSLEIARELMIQSIGSQCNPNSHFRAPMIGYSAIIQGFLPLSTLRGGLKGLVKRLGTLLPSFSKGGSGTNLKSLANLMKIDLANRFVIQTTIADIRQFWSSFEEATKQYRRLADINRKKYVAIKSDWTSFTLTDDQGLWNVDKSHLNRYGFRVYDYANHSNYVSSHVNTHRGRTSYVARRMHALFEVEYPNLDPAFTTVEQWLHDTGLGNPLQSAWDLIPMSFVVDYFLHIDELIDRLSEHLWSDDTTLRCPVCRVIDVWEETKVVTSDYVSLDEEENDYVEELIGPGDETLFLKTRLNAGESVKETGFYERKRVDDPSLIQRLTEYCRQEFSGRSHIVDYDVTGYSELSDTRKRTLAELGFLALNRRSARNQKTSKARERLLAWLAKQRQKL